RELPARPSSADAYLAGVREARQLFTAMTQPLDLAAFPNAYQADLRRLIDAKIAGSEILMPLVVAAPIVSFRDALEQSLAAVRVTKQPPFRSTMAKRNVSARERKRAS